MYFMDDNELEKKRTEDLTARESLEYLKRRIGEEKKKREESLSTFGQIEAKIDFMIEANNLLDSSDIAENDQKRVRANAYVNDWRNEFDRDYPPDEEHGNQLRRHSIYSTAAGSAYYGMITGSYPQIADDTLIVQADRNIEYYEDLQRSQNRIDEVIRKLAWISEKGANKFKAAWEALELGTPSTDPSTGPAILLRSALDITIRTDLLNKTPKPHPDVKRKYLVHIAEYLARDSDSEYLLSSQASLYYDITDELSKVKGSTAFDQQRLRVLFFQATDLLHIILESIDEKRLS